MLCSIYFYGCHSNHVLSVITMATDDVIKVSLVTISMSLKYDKYILTVPNKIYSCYKIMKLKKIDFSNTYI